MVLCRQIRHTNLPLRRATLFPSCGKLTRVTRAFLPATCTGSIEIRAYDEFNYAVQRVIQTRIQPLAPRMHFHVSALTYDCVNELLNGTVDYAVVYEGFNDNRLNFECFSQTGDIFLLCRKGHPLLSGDFSASDLSCSPLVEIDNYRDNSSPLLVDICHEVGSNMCVRAYTESVASAFQLIASSDSVAVICNQRFVSPTPLRAWTTSNFRLRS